MKPRAVESIMTKEVVCVSPSQKLIDVKHIYEKSDFHHHIPVIENDRLVGMVSLIDFMYRIKGAGLDDSNEIYHKLTVKDIMTPNPYTVKTSTPIQDVAEELGRGRFRAIPVLEGDKVAGIVSTADVIKFYLEQQKRP
ncbi:CBS domain-containing protein [Aureitalea sp. L0-47]|uniref:CBS domain-containing protein n=1 Tax=Aureitalea sp. L0-47 TaxID=2816962 RepID=UPI002238306F|nr:CBS domain-containing protein [Aureitalea sp. L0-47]MCW5520083.1 CBS domain-containing protein [Aureitalea sp. L0-47]